MPEISKTNKIYEAINVWERAISIRPRQHEALVSLGDLYKKKRLYKEATQRYWSALKIKKNDKKTRAKLGEIFTVIKEIEAQQLKKKKRNSMVRGSVARSP